MKPVCFSICCAFVKHSNQWTVTELRIKKSVNENASFRLVYIGSYSG